MLVKITPKMKRAKERVKSHGDTMRFLSDAEDTLAPMGSVFVESLEETHSLFGEPTKWIGWFAPEEADFDFIPEEGEV